MTQSSEPTPFSSSIHSLLESLVDQDEAVPADFRPPVDALDAADASECTSMQPFQNENRVACPDGLSEPQRLAIELLVIGERRRQGRQEGRGEPLDPLARIIHVGWDKLVQPIGGPSETKARVVYSMFWHREW